MTPRTPDTDTLDRSFIGSAPSNDGFHRDALAFSILALAQHRLGNLQDARPALANAQQIVSQKMPKTGKGETFDDDWHDWLHAQILCREPETLLTESPAKP